MYLHLYVCIRASGSGAFLFLFNLSLLLVYLQATTSGTSLGNLYFPTDISGQLNYTLFYLKSIWWPVPFLKISVFPINLFIRQLYDFFPRCAQVISCWIFSKVISGSLLIDYLLKWFYVLHLCFLWGVGSFLGAESGCYWDVGQMSFSVTFSCITLNWNFWFWSSVYFVCFLCFSLWEFVSSSFLLPFGSLHVQTE